jgi:hypothetical protein
MTSRKPDTPNWAMDFGEKIQRPNIFSQSLVRLFAGCSSPHYRQAVWNRVREVVGEDEEPITLPIGEADPEASLFSAILPRLKKEAVVVGSGRTALFDIWKDTGGLLAAAMTYKGENHAGILPNGEIDLGYLDETDQSIVAQRAGRNDWGVGLGVYIPSGGRSGEGGKLIVPQDTSIVEQHVPIPLLADRYPDVTLV